MTPERSDHSQNGGTSAEADAAGTGQDGPGATVSAQRANTGAVARTAALGRAAWQRIARG
jgi:hypothetical protein